MQKKAEFTKLVSDGFYQLDQGQLAGARAKFRAANVLDRKSKIVTDAIKDIDNRIKVLRIDKLKNDLQVSIANEDFLKAKIATDALVEEDPSFRYGNQSAVFLRNIAVETEIDLLLSKLKSLSSVKNRKRIEQLFAKHDEKSILDFGQRISEKYLLLKKRYERLAKKVQIELLSDGKSPVIIMPGGKLGKFNKMIINLYPGIYTISIRCVGRKESHQKLEISPDQDRKVIDLECKS